MRSASLLAATALLLLLGTALRSFAPAEEPVVAEGREVVREVRSPEREERRPDEFAALRPGSGDSRGRLRELGKRLGVRITYEYSTSPETSPTGCVYEQLSEEQLLRASVELERALERYDRALFDRLPLYDVNLCKKLMWNGQEWAGFWVMEERCIYLSAETGSEIVPMGEIVHHELFHAIDTVWNPDADSDEEWQSLGGSGISYLGSSEDRGSSAFGADLPGYVSEYARTSATEDKACTYDAMSLSPDWMKERAEHDPVLAAKMAMILERLREMDLSRLLPAFADWKAPGSASSR